MYYASFFQKLAQKDIDARWTKKNNNTFYCYKNHVKADTKTKLIEEFIVTDAPVHDSQAIEQLLTDKDEGQPLYTDSVYKGEDQEAVYKKEKVCIAPMSVLLELQGQKQKSGRLTSLTIFAAVLN
jgi:IS5 family transposase